MLPFLVSAGVPQGFGPAAVRGVGPTRHGCQRVRSHDDLPQQGADRREPDAAGGQPAERRHRPAAKLRLGQRDSHPRPLNPPRPSASLTPKWLKNHSPSDGAEHTDLNGLLVPDFCFSKMKC